MALVMTVSVHSQKCCSKDERWHGLIRTKHGLDFKAELTEH